MSRGPFILRRYESSNLLRRVKIWVQPETPLLTLAGFGANNQPPGAVNLSLTANVGMAPSGLGIRPRLLVIRFPVGAPPPAGYRAGVRLRVPILRPMLWDAAIPGVSTGVYLGRPFQVVGKLPEITR